MQGPEAVREQVGRVAEALQEILGADLIGLYLHGSLAMGCFHPAASDIDLLAVTRSALPEATRMGLARRLPALSGSPAPLEISILSEADLHPWRFPTPFQLHYSEDWRERFSQGLAADSLPAQPETDPDLAAHITIVRHRGIVLVGPPAAQIFPLVPPDHYLAAIWEHDTRQAGDWVRERPVYWVLNLCRVLAYARDGQITSKAEGGAWALTALPEIYHPVVRLALERYRGGSGGGFDPAALRRFVAFMGAAIDNTSTSSPFFSDP